MYEIRDGMAIRYSSAPARLTLANGLNFTKSIGNPSSRLERVREYLRVNGPSRKLDIVQNVFGKTVDDTVTNWKIRRENRLVTRGWGSYVFLLGVRYGFFVKVRKNNTVYWCLPEQCTP